MHFPVACFYVLLGLFAVGSSVPTGAKRLARLKLNQQTSFFNYSTYSVGDELKNVADSTKPTVEFTFIYDSEGLTHEAVKRPEAVAYAKSNAFLILQHVETVIGFERPYIVRFTNMSPAASVIAKTSGFRFRFRALDDDGQYRPYACDVGACREKCIDPGASVQRPNPDTTIFEGSVLQPPTQKNVMDKCVEYLRTAFQRPRLYFPSVSLY
ncbi:hypothetical protein GGU10DRAFT_118205 [Lentinula aff. detonsa]|uniref:Uncharacterized protein n=1 Tax=Lentinula aff. detonsa TaxID=2804958 RepID=A0AA38NBI8_9AGAR|nr:hypothetical protein GGU10DRAFT_118205 [Lentinula aff. detonsa]